jgi:hypothetical protein
MVDLVLQQNFDPDKVNIQYDVDLHHLKNIKINLLKLY